MIVGSILDEIYYLVLIEFGSVIKSHSYKSIVPVKKSESVKYNWWPLDESATLWGEQFGIEHCRIGHKFVNFMQLCIDSIGIETIDLNDKKSFITWM